MLHGAATAALKGYCLKQQYPCQATVSIFCYFVEVTGALWCPGVNNYLCGGLVGE